MDNFNPQSYMTHQNLVNVVTVNQLPTSTYYTYQTPLPNQTSVIQNPNDQLQNLVTMHTSHLNLQNQTQNQIIITSNDCLTLPLEGLEQAEHYRWDGPAERIFQAPSRKRFIQYRGKILQVLSDASGQNEGSTTTQIQQAQEAVQETKTQIRLAAPRRSSSNGLTEEEIAERKRRHAERERMRRKNMTPEQKVIYLQKEKERRERNKERINKWRYEKNHANWEETKKRNHERYLAKKAQMSDEQRKAKVQAQLERKKALMANMTPEEIEAYKEKMRVKGRERYAAKKLGEYRPRKNRRAQSLDSSTSSGLVGGQGAGTREVSEAPSGTSFVGGRDSSMDFSSAAAAPEASATVKIESPRIQASQNSAPPRSHPPVPVQAPEDAIKKARKEKIKNIYFKNHLRHCIFYEFQLGHNVWEATQNIRKALGQEVVTQQMCQHWFTRFKEGKVGLETLNPKFVYRTKDKVKKQKKMENRKSKAQTQEDLQEETPPASPVPEHTPIKRGRKPKNAVAQISKTVASKKGKFSQKLKEMKKKALKKTSSKPAKKKVAKKKKQISDDEEEDAISIYSEDDDFDIDSESDPDFDAPSTSTAKKARIDPASYTPSAEHKYPTRNRTIIEEPTLRSTSSPLQKTPKPPKKPKKSKFSDLMRVLELDKLDKPSEPSTSHDGHQTPEEIPNPMSIPPTIRLPIDVQVNEMPEDSEAQITLRTILYGGGENGDQEEANGVDVHENGAGSNVVEEIAQNIVEEVAQVVESEQDAHNFMENGQNSIAHGESQGLIAQRPNHNVRSLITYEQEPISEFD